MSRNSRWLISAIACLATAGCFWETPDSSFDTASDAIDAGLVYKGWIPGWLPHDAVELREVHNIDTSASELSFEIPGARSLKLPDDCKPIAYAQTVPAIIQRRWWPSEEALRTEYRFFKCDADAAGYVFVGLRNDGKRVVHWRTYGR
ncbi:hypothetical protein [Noviluteimonas gilva]|uniref:YbbD head domain-containing protein n=1 Tax=Noviluteimonas gilva TaxID=2682097 RepID=A0A7C9HWR9_9GAMM|nr:hypothetical protein [Lysobacter gilvus]MUV15458.1 hypothetical protein [Lysobacter gilvus]